MRLRKQIGDFNKKIDEQRQISEEEKKQHHRIQNQLEENIRKEKTRLDQQLTLTRNMQSKTANLETELKNLRQRGPEIIYRDRPVVEYRDRTVVEYVDRPVESSGDSWCSIF